MGYLYLGLSFLGVTIVSFSDSHSPEPKSEHPRSRPLFGDLLALNAALFYALYVTLLKKVIRSENRIDMQLFFGFVGLCNVSTFWPIGFLLDFLHIEGMELPTRRKDIAALLLNVCCFLVFL
jgi:solute carrier family 35 protein F5